ncbi:MAG: DUF5009 domain-containing protein [Fuerstiella sp.]|nr:DUF5009 domain-containing protein [Fuerstiella sp.]
MSKTYRVKKSEQRPRRPTGTAEAEYMLPVPKHSGRLRSLDAYRGFIMIVLAAHGFGFSDFTELPRDAPVWKTTDYDVWQTIGFHFRHAKWVAIDTIHGIAFWDLIQPSFMFMVGVAMPFSGLRRSAAGQSSWKRLLHALIRAVILVLLGVFLYSLKHPRTNWIFSNVLAQIGLGYFFVYLLLNQPRMIQLTAVTLILIGYWSLFYFNPAPQDYDYAAMNADVDNGDVFTDQMAPWSKNGNVAFRFDQWLLPQLRTPRVKDLSTAAEQATGKNSDTPDEVIRDPQPTPGRIRQWFFSNPNEYQFNRSGYTTLNFVPSMATTLLGVLCGQLLISRKRRGYKVVRLLVGGAICISLGLAMHLTVCPIIKIIWTPSWTLFSSGCVVWILAVFYIVFDILPFGKLAWPLQVVGMNSLAVYLMGQLLHSWVGEKVVAIHLSGFLESIFGADAVSDAMFGRIIEPTFVVLIFWLAAVYMYRHRFFVRV